MCFAELPRPDRVKVLAEQAVARKKTELQVSTRPAQAFVPVMCALIAFDSDQAVILFQVVVDCEVGLLLQANFITSILC